MTLPDDKSKQDFESYFETLDIADMAATKEVSGGKTIVPAPQTEFRGTKELPKLHTSDTSHAELRVVGQIGEGGMGIIQLARQQSLKRDVALKTLKRRDDGAARGLLQEAFITGHLEHPNIIPVYNLGQDDEGAPILVMKRIEGVSWLNVMLGMDRPPSGESVSTAWHVRILMSLCDALRFAHSKGFVHRDIKPENVMIGAFGEVYLLDWGIALRVDGETSQNYPNRESVRGIAGTPAYMAPEMTRDDGMEIDARTDVYLLGACLHEVLTGEVRHQGGNLMDIMFSAFNSKPIEYGSEVSSELGSVANRAMAVDKEERFQSVDDFKQALQDYLDHRSSVDLARESAFSLSQLEGLLAQETPTEAQEQRIHDLFVECRFGFRQALKLWMGNQSAKDGLQTCLVLLVGHHIDRGELTAARSVLGELEGDFPELNERIQAATLEAEGVAAEFQALQRFARDLDTDFGSRSRALLALILGLVWTLLALKWAWTDPDPFGTIGFESYLFGVLKSCILPMALVLIFSRFFFRNQAGRQILMIFVGGLIAMGVIRTLSYVMMLESLPQTVLEWTTYGLSLVGIGAIAERRIALLGSTYFLAAIAATIDPYHFVYYLVIAHTIVFFRLAWIWGIFEKPEKA